MSMGWSEAFHMNTQLKGCSNGSKGWIRGIWGIRSTRRILHRRTVCDGMNDSFPQLDTRRAATELPIAALLENHPVSNYRRKVNNPDGRGLQPFGFFVRKTHIWKHCVAYRTYAAFVEWMAAYDASSDFATALSAFTFGLACFGLDCCLDNWIMV